MKYKKTFHIERSFLLGINLIFWNKMIKMVQVFAKEEGE